MEFQAVVLCGEGRNLAPIAGEGTPKALLPVANRPLVSYVLDWCERALFSKTILATPPALREEITAYVGSRPSIEVVEVDGTTGEVLALLQPHLTSDFVVLPCDFITDVDPELLVATQRSLSQKTLISGFYYNNTFETLDKKTLSPDILLHTPCSGPDPVLLDVYTRQQVRDAKKLTVRMAMMWKFANVTASTEILYAGIYFCRRRVLDIVADSADDASVAVSGHSIHKVVRDFARRTWQHRRRLDEVSFQVLPSTCTFLRANNLLAYLEANRYMMKLRARTAGKPATTVKDKSAAVIGNDALVADSSTIGDRSSVKRTVVGQNCVVGTKCRLTGCVILDDVKIDSDVVLENCIIGPGAAVGTKSRLTSCNVAGGYRVIADTEAKNETLQGGNADDSDEYADLYQSLSDDDSDSQAPANTESEFSDDDSVDEQDDLFER